MVKITYSLMTACVLIFFFVRLTPLIPLPDYIEATVLQYRPYIDFVVRCHTLQQLFSPLSTELIEIHSTRCLVLGDNGALRQFWNTVLCQDSDLLQT